MSTGTAKTPQAVEGRSPASAVPEGQTPRRPMTPTLRHYAERFLSLGEDRAAHFVNRMADSCEELNAITPGFGDALHRNFAQQMMDRLEAKERVR
jgi:hypothetical protein